MAVVNSKVEIYNQALDACGVQTVSSTTEDSNEARICNRFYGPTLDAMLRKHNWNFATRIVSLTESAESTPGFAFTYQLPEDFLKLVIITNNQYPFRIVGDKLVTNASSVTLEYIARVTDVSKYDALFVTAFYLELATRIIYKFNQSSNARQELKQDAKDALREARSADGQEGTNYNMQQTQWEQSRYSATIDGGF